MPNSDKVVWSVHCHNDLGLAVANSLSAVLNGARQVECTINGLGERAGNAALEEIVMAVRTRQDMFPCETRIDATQIVPASRLVSGITGFPVQPNKAIVGANAFAHESGIHQDGVLKSRETYEIMRAQDVGWNANKLVLGKHCGRNAFKTRLAELGIAHRVRRSAQRRVQALQGPRRQEARDLRRGPAGAHLRKRRRRSRGGALPARLADRALGDRRAAVRAHRHGGRRARSARRSRRAAVRSTRRSRRSRASSKSGAELLLYSVNSITTGTDAQGEVTVRLSKGGRIVNGQGADTDIVVASAKAYIDALNKLQSKLRAGEPAGVALAHGRGDASADASPQSTPGTPRRNQVSLRDLLSFTRGVAWRSADVGDRR